MLSTLNGTFYEQIIKTCKLSSHAAYDVPFSKRIDRKNNRLA